MSITRHGQAHCRSSKRVFPGVPVKCYRKGYRGRTLSNETVVPSKGYVSTLMAPIQPSGSLPDQVDHVGRKWLSGSRDHCRFKMDSTH